LKFSPDTQKNVLEYNKLYLYMEPRETRSKINFMGGDRRRGVITMEKRIRNIMCEMAIVEELLKFCHDADDVLGFIDEANRQINQAISGRKDCRPATRADIIIANNQRREVATRILDMCEKHPEVSVGVHCYGEIMKLRCDLVGLIDYTKIERERLHIDDEYCPVVL
jgi:hypothetical protein